MSNFYNRHFKPAVVRALPAKLHGLRLHDMRHTAASLRYVASGGDLKVVQEVLGHASLSTTGNIYLHAFNQAHKVAVGNLEAMGTAAFGSEPAPDATVTPIG
jgi:integrase